ncbi:hypothetical protein CHS0354_027449 [Potamilus streckersoni]|uniref:Uncharacterized protein n=1 Tax=Potamilus streckersoni TaxID=2493646 RepID=A0AAE0T678_9BIVA|nr:hypothetical protein CHS0354_027449 [Potamilus streckersoni]
MNLSEMAGKNVVPNLSAMCDLPRRKSSDILDTAEDLCDNLDNLADILTEIEANYQNYDVSDNGNMETKTSVGAKLGVFSRLKDGLDSAKSLINCLKREKWRLSRRELSVELRMGELEDYKSHLKQDMSSLNELVDVLSMRVIQLENTLVEQQEIQEVLEAEKTDLRERLKASEAKSHELELHKQELITELKELSLERSDASYKKENLELKTEMEIIMEENKQLKEMLRLKAVNEEFDKGDLGNLESIGNETNRGHSVDDNLDPKNNNKLILDGRKPDKDNKL